jgi:hypothetical protein
MTTTNKGLTDPANGSLNWDTPLNANFEIVDKAFGGAVTKNVTALTGTITLAEADYQNMAILFTGTLGANLIYQVPSGVGGQWLLVNATSGAFTLTFRTSAPGTTVTVPQGKNLVAYSNGTDIYYENALISPLSISGGTQAWTITASGTNLTFAYNGVNKLTLTSAGALTTSGDITAFGAP